ncbi:chemotaxis protein CheW [Synechococcus sp. PCC 7336]|uniref:chemotaxis protein CheW n=1 Tax=Synechococcus sp. PCC 7336 TaxID=195250 RepID=UPI0003692022|nr:chemotaxis protein CheW [Synechococcus sp. PCC 7336]
MSEQQLQAGVTGLEGFALEPPAPDLRQAFLRLQLGEEWALLPLAQATEILHIHPVDILPVPAMPTWVLGVYNWRGEMLWMLDLNALTGMTSVCELESAQQSVKAIVVQVGQQKLGIAVQAVQDIELYDEDRLQEAGPGVFPEQLLPYLGGYFIDAGPVIDTRTLDYLPLS